VSGVWIQDQPHQRLILGSFFPPTTTTDSASTRNSHRPCPSPLYRDVGWLILPQRMDRGRKNTRGDPESGRPTRCVKKISRDESRGSFSAFVRIPTNWPRPSPTTTCPTVRQGHGQGNVAAIQQRPTTARPQPWPPLQRDGHDDSTKTTTTTRRQHDHHDHNTTTTTMTTHPPQQQHDHRDSPTSRMPGMGYPTTTKTSPSPITTKRAQDSRERRTASGDAQAGMAGPTGQPMTARKPPRDPRERDAEDNTTSKPTSPASTREASPEGARSRQLNRGDEKLPNGAKTNNGVEPGGFTLLVYPGRFWS